MYLDKPTNWDLRVSSLQMTVDHRACQKPILKLGDGQRITIFRLPSFDDNEINLMQ